MPRAQRREQLLDVTLDLLAGDGFDALSMEAVARRAGVNRVVVYRSFANLQVLLVALLRREDRRTRRTLEALIPADPAGRAPAELLGEALSAFLAAVIAEPRTWRVALLRPESAPIALQRLVNRRRAQLARRLEPLVRWGVAELPGAPPELDHRARRPDAPERRRGAGAPGARGSRLPAGAAAAVELGASGPPARLSSLRADGADRRPGGAQRAGRGRRAGPTRAAIALRTAIVTCMDARIDVYAALGLAPGEAHVLRNAGGIVTDDVLRSLAISQRRLGTEAVLLIHHTRCGMEGLDEDALRAELTEAAGEPPPFALGGFASVEDDVRQSIARVRECAYLSHRDAVRGFVIDVETGRLSEVEAA